MWRAEDQALLTRLEHEQLFERLWALHTRGAAPPPAGRAPALVAALARAEGGADVVRDAVATGDVRPVAARLSPDDVRDLPPELNHHLALYFARAADALDAEDARAARTLRLRSIASWLALADERRYLASLARDVAGGALGEAELVRVAGEVPFEPLDALGARATEGARAMDATSGAALATLAEIAAACRIARASDATAERAKRRAAALRHAAIDVALAPIGEALSAGAASGELASRGRALLARVVEAWRWADRDEAAERFAVEQAAPVAWDLFRAEAWEPLRELGATIAPLVDMLAARILEGRASVAYAAACAEMLVFRAQLETRLDAQIAVAERALEVCPSHRNARLVLASFLCDRARMLVPAHAVFVRKDAIDEAEACVDRAERLYPQSSRLADARARVRDARRRGW